MLRVTDLNNVGRREEARSEYPSNSFRSYEYKDDGTVGGSGTMCSEVHVHSDDPCMRLHVNTELFVKPIVNNKIYLSSVKSKDSGSSLGMIVFLDKHTTHPVAM
jgi:hypothetical protein